MTTGIILAGSTPWLADSFASLGPRLLLPVANRPVAGHLFAWFERSGIHQIVVCVDAGASLLIRGLEALRPPKLELFYQVDQLPRGPAGCIRDAAAWHESDRYLIVEGSVIPRMDATALLIEHGRTGATLTLAALPRALDNDQPESFAEPLGAYVLEHEALRYIPLTSFQDLKETLVPKLLKDRHPVQALPCESVPARVGDLINYLEAQALILNAQSWRYMQDGYELRSGSWVHHTARVHSTARLIGDVMVGPQARIDPHVTIVGPAVVGPYSVLGEKAVLSCSVMMDHCFMPPNSRMDLSVLASRSAIDARERRYAEVIIARRNSAKPPRAPVKR